MKFPQFLTYCREKSGLNKSALASKIGVSSQYIINLEKGKDKPPTSERLEKISEILHLDDVEKKKLFELALDERTGNKDLGFHQVLGTQPLRSAKKVSDNDSLDKNGYISDLVQLAHKSSLIKIKAVIELLK